MMLVGVLLLISPSLHAQNWDINTLGNINPTNPSSSYWQKTSSSAYPVAVGIPAGILIAGYVKHDKELEMKGWKIVGALAVNTVISEGLKYAVNRERPYEKYPLLVHPYDATEKGQSLPSGHTSTVFAMAASLSIQCHQWYVVVPAYAYAASVGYSRLYLGEHYPTDVLAGAAVGVGSAYLSNWLAKKIFKLKN
jgi:undecaprenyl-diphosphatase